MVSRSGQIVSPCMMRSSPTLTTAVSSLRIDDIAKGAKQSSRADAAAENGYHPRDLRGAWVSSSAVSTSRRRLARHTGVRDLSFARWRGRRESPSTATLGEVRPWASVSKMAVAMAFGVEFDWDLHAYDGDGRTSRSKLRESSFALERPRTRRR